MLEVSNLACHKGGRELFAGLSFHVMPGQCWVVEGENGCGKTSLLRILAALSQPERGELRWYGQCIRTVGAAYQQAVLYGAHSVGMREELSVEENLHYLLCMDGVKVKRESYVAALKRFSLYGLRRQPLYKLSAGQKKRCFLLRLAVSTRPLWILDEQLSALDQQGQLLLGQLISQHMAAQGAVLLTSHQALPWSVDTLHLRLGQ